MKRTFENNIKADEKAEALRCMESRAEDFRGFMKHGTDQDDARGEEAKAFFEETGSFYDYGLCLDYVLPDSEHEGWLRYQLSTGGPGEEVRFYYSPGNWEKPYRIEFVFLCWGGGIGFDVTGEDWAQWLSEWFGETAAAEAAFKEAAE